MRLIVDDLPRTPKECLFGWKHLEYSKWRCKFGGECELSGECRQCSHLVTFAADKNVGTKLGTNLAEVGTDCISRQEVIDALRDWEMCYDWDEHCREEPKELCVVSPSDVINKLPPIQPVIEPCDYAKACNEATMDKLTSAVVYYDALEELRKHGYVLVDVREVTT